MTHEHIHWTGQKAVEHTNLKYLFHRLIIIRFCNDLLNVVQGKEGAVGSAALLWNLAVKEHQKN